ncbi:G2/M phase-specific E3 ubiquitin-protein ligase isoform X2 [Oreochromis niloticus]|uniref:G2/M phase-specific E3 ubiquitin-protein ligase isoform X2 n=1 Tax=Oreochromis niloticus TaxID=8128 RepID=UPI000905749A|nr:G2/M phase-specific E3 ubiquitin-protein ligase isoform X2 [Oreochromis niloticus]
MAMLKLQHGFNTHSGAANMTLLFEGQQNHLVPSTSQILADSDFVVAGRMIGHSFLNDGPRLHGLSKAIIHMLVHADRDTVTVQLDDVPDLDIRSTIYRLDGNKHLTEQQKDDINNLAISWDLPPVSAENCRWLFQQLLHHAVIG